MTSRLLTLIACAATLLGAASLQAQEQPLEFSVDGGFDYTFQEFSDDIARFLLPIRMLRVATGVSPRVSLEGGFGFSRAQQGDDNSTDLFFAPGVTFHFRDYESERARPYVSVLGGMSYLDAESGNFAAGDTAFGVSARLGTKLPFAGAGFVRLEGGLGYWAESDLRNSATVVSLTVGLGAVLD